MHGDGQRLIFSVASGMQQRGYAPCMRRKERPRRVCLMAGGKGGVEDKRKCPDGLNVKKSV